MARKKRSSKAGLPAGSLVYIGDREGVASTVTVTRFGPESYEETPLARLSPESLAAPGGIVTWVQVRGAASVETVEAVGRAFCVHPLLLEDILNTQQRPKLDDQGGYLYLVLKSIEPSEGGIHSEQVSLLLGDRFVVTFQEGASPLFAPVEERLRAGKGKIRRLGPDFLAYALFDLVVDRYFAVMEGIQDRVEDIEEELVVRPRAETLKSMHLLKRDMIFLRRSIWPLRDVLSALQRIDTPLVTDGTRFYLRDVHDHAVQIIDSAESLRDLLSEMTDIYLSSLSNRLAEVMKFLTAISTIFIPMTFLAGVYGMNFKFMPPLEEPWGFFACLGLMAAVGLSLFTFFRTRKWL